MSEHHATLSPSSFPMLAKCPCYKSGEPGEAAESGSRQHALLAVMLNDAEVIPEDCCGCDETEREQVEWATGYVRRNTGDNRLIEERMSLLDDDFEEVTFGTLDIVEVVNRAQGDRLVVMDYKSGEDHGYLLQMAVYARMAMLRFDKTICEVHEVYGRLKKINKYDMTLTDTNVIFDVIAGVNAANKQPCMNEFCKWCEKQGQCHETTEAIVKVATEYEPDNAVAKLPLSEVTTWHSSDITDPKQMAIVLEVADYLGNWSKTVKAHAKTAALKGMEIPGYFLKETRGNRAFANITSAYNASGLDSDEFLACCTASVPDVEKAMKAKSGLKGKAASDFFDLAMQNIVVRKKSSVQLERTN